MAIGTLRLPPHYLDELTPYELGLLMENHQEQQKEHYEMIAYAVRVGYVSAKKGKNISMFEKEQKNKVSKTTKEEKAKTFAELDSIFGGSH